MKHSKLKKYIALYMSFILMIIIFAMPLGVKAQGETVLPSGLDLYEVRLLLDEEINEKMKDMTTSALGGAVRISVEDECIYNTDFGFADRENSLLVSEETVFEWGTASQLLVWVSVLQLAEEGLLDLDVEVSELLPEGDLKEELTESGITLMHLMNYSSGLQDNLSEKIVPEGAAYGTLEETLTSNIPKQVYAAGSVVSVADWPVALAAYIVEYTSGTDYAEYVKQEIFTPLNMEHTALLPDLSDNEWVMNARGETKSYQGSQAFATNFYHIPLYPAGMVTGTADDFHMFACELLNQSEESVLFDKAETAETLFDTTLSYTSSEEARIAHGMFVYRLGVPVYGVDGNSATQTALVFMEPETKTCLTYMTNQYNENVLSKFIAETVFGATEVNKTEELSGLRVYEGVYVPGNATVDGKLTFNAVLSAMFLTLGENNTLVMPMFGNSSMFEIIDENHVVSSDGNIGNLHAYTDGTTVIMLPMQDYVSYSAFTFWAQVITFFVMLAGYFYSSLVVLVAVFGFIMRKFSKEKLEPSKFRKYHYIQCLNVTLFSLIFAFMAMSALAYSPAGTISATSMMYWLGSVMSIIYLWFFYRSGRNEEVSKKTKVLYWTTAVFAVVTIVFALLFGLIL